MSQRIVVGGLGEVDLLDAILADLRVARPPAVGIVSAYVTVSGVQRIKPVLDRVKVTTCRLVAGIDDEITHPEALKQGLSFGWDVRIATSPQGRFHPKMIVGGKEFNSQDELVEPTFFYIGSGNLTQPGLQVNTECAVIGRGDGFIAGAESAFTEFWRLADEATPDAIKHYAARFAERNRARKPEVLEALGVAETRLVSEATVTKLRAQASPRQMAVSQQFATAAWTGLQSFTGEYRFQIEFPRAAGEVIARLAGALKGGDVDVVCEDGSVRRMTYRFYMDNGMFRLNVPNDVLGVQWARANRDGVAMVSHGPEGGAPLRLAILQPGPEANEVIARSYVLNTWGRTSTRLYGWF